jgi:acyl carrier protein
MKSNISNNIEKEIRLIVAEILEVDESKIMPNSKFVDDLGMDSMMALEILASVEKKYKIKIPEEYLTKVTSIDNMVEIAKKIMSGK